MPRKTLQLLVFGPLFLTIISFTSTFADEGSEESPNPAPRFALRFRFEDGQQLRYQTTQKITQQAVAPAGRKTDTTKVEQRRLFRISDVTDSGEAKASMQFESVHMEMQSDDRPPVVFDSSMPAKDVPQIFRSAAHRLRGAAPVYELHCSGTPISGDGYEDTSAAGQASFMFPLPPEPIRVGDTWKANIKVQVRVAEGIMRDIKLLRTYQLSSVKNDIALIEFSTSLATRVRSPSARAQLLQATPQGTISFDITRGRVIRKEMTFDQSVLGALGSNTLLGATGRTVDVLLTESEDSVTTN